MMYIIYIFLIKLGKLYIVVFLIFVSIYFLGICKNLNFWWDIKLCKIVVLICIIIYDCLILFNRDLIWIIDIIVFKVGRYIVELF